MITQAFNEGDQVRVTHGTKHHEGVVVGHDQYQLWYDIKHDGEVHNYFRDELEPIGGAPNPSTIPTGDIEIGELVQTPDGDIGFTIRVTDYIRWRIYIPSSDKFVVFNEAVLTKMIAIPEPEPKPCTAIVPVTGVRTITESVYTPSTNALTTAYLMLSIVYASKWLDMWMLFGGAVKEIKRLKSNPNTIKPSKQPDTINIYQKAYVSDKFDHAKLSAIGDAQALLNAVQSQLVHTEMTS